MIEYSDLPAELAELREPDGGLQLWAGSIAVHVLERAFVERLVEGDVRLPFHRAIKKVPFVDDQRRGRPGPRPPTPSSSSGSSSTPCRWPSGSPLVETDRAVEFEPLKNATGPDSPATVRQRMSDQFADWLEAAGAEVERRPDGSVPFGIEISPLYALDAAELKAKLAARPGRRGAARSPPEDGRDPGRPSQSGPRRPAQGTMDLGGPAFARPAAPGGRTMPRLALLCVGLLASTTSYAQSPDSILKDKGLKRSGTAYLLPAEAEVIKQVGVARGLFNQLAADSRQIDALAAECRESKQVLAELMSQRVMLSQQMNQPLPVADHNRLVTVYNEAGDRINLIQNNLADPEAEKSLRARAARSRESYLQAMLDLRRLVNAADLNYAAIAGDAEIKSALDSINSASKAKSTLGPSKAYLDAVKLFAKAEAMIQTESIALRQEGGVNWVNVTVNGRTVIPMVFDAGAASSASAPTTPAKAGLTPGPSDPIIRLTTADGTVNEAKRMTLSSVRVGKFTVENVNCAVMAPQSDAAKKDAPPLLGQTFLKNFTYRIDPGTNTLTLTRVNAEVGDGGKAPAKAAARKDAAKKARAKGKGSAKKDAEPDGTP